MATKARLKRDGLLLDGELNERPPTIADSLILNYPFDGIAKAVTDNNLLDYSTWVIGSTGSQTGFSQNGDGNSIINDLDPFNNHTAIWQSLNNDVTSDADGGWNGSLYAIDNTQTYRFSVWIQRRVLGNGSFYFGLRDSGGDVLNRSNNATNTNPYFKSGSGSIIFGEWFLLVGHVWPTGSGAGAVHADSGIYDRYGNVVTTTSDFIWSTTTSVGHRSYLYYSTLPETEQLWAYPRIDLCDGTEPTISDLLNGINGEGGTLNPITNTNNTLASEGIAVEQSATNYLSDGVSGYNAADKTCWIGTTTYVFNPVLNKNVISWDSSTGSYVYTHDYVLDDDLVTLSGQTVTFSLMLRRVDGAATGRIRMYDNVSNYSYQSVDVTQEFQKFQLTKTLGSSPTRIFVMIDNTGGGTYEFYDAQVEINTFPTSYVDGTRGTGYLYILNPVTTGEYTVSFKCKINTNIGDSISYQTIMSMGSYYTNNSWTIMDTGSSTVSGTQRFIRKGNAAEWGWISANLTETTNFQDENIITVVRNSTNYRVYSNGDYKGTIAHSSTTMQDYIYIGSRNSSGSIGSSIISDLCIYDRALSDDEIMNLSTNALQINDNVQLKDELFEEPLVPSDVLYFPLSYDGYDSYRDIATDTETTQIYENGSVYIGKGTTNLSYDSGVANWSIANLTASVTKTEIIPNIVYRITSTTGGAFRLYVPAAKLTNALPYNMSFKFKIISGGPNFYMTDWCDTALVNHIQTDFGTYKFSSAYGVRATYDSTYHFMDFVISADTIIEIWDVQTEQRMFSTPFTNDVEAAGKHTYVVSDIVGETKDWSVGIFAKPNVFRMTGTETGRMSALAIGNYYVLGESDSNAGYRWGGTGLSYFGCRGYNNQVGESYGTYYPAAEELEDWIFFAFTYDEGINLETFYIYTNAGLQTASNTRTHTGLDPIITIGGYSWDYNAWEGELRDLIMADRVLSSAEISTIYQTNMRLYNDKAHISSQILEGVTL